jgi:drug/metabolite transporter (DMT)-like permease
MRLIKTNSLPISLNSRKSAILALIIANVVWGAASPIFKLALENIPPFTLAFLRFYFATIILFPFAVKNLWIDKKTIIPLVLMSLSGITANVSFFFLGLEKAPSINAPIIASSGPVFLYIISMFILMEKPQKKLLAGILVSFLGVLFIVIQPVLANGVNGEILGNIFFVIATLGAVGQVIFAKKISTRYSTLTLTFWSFFISALTFFPLYYREMVTLQPLLRLDWRGIMGIIFGILFSSVLAYTLYVWGLKKITAQEIGLFTYIDPLAATIIAIPLLGEHITPVFILGSFFVFAGIFIAEGRINYHPLHKLRNLKLVPIHEIE